MYLKSCRVLYTNLILNVNFNLILIVVLKLNIDQRIYLIIFVLVNCLVRGTVYPILLYGADVFSINRYIFVVEFLHLELCRRIIKVLMVYGLG